MLWEWALVGAGLPANTALVPETFAGKPAPTEPADRVLERSLEIST